MKMEHPSVRAQQDWVDKIRSTAAEAERTGLLHPKQLAVIYDQHWFKLLIPKQYSGLELAIPDLVRLEETISWINGSVGWVVTLCSGAGWFGGFLAAEKAIQVFENQGVCLAGSGAATGEAVITPGGYRINGLWKYASGAHHATHFTANCVIKNENGVIINDNGDPIILPFIFDRKDVTILPAWKYTGMAATGSDAFEAVDLEVRVNNCFEIKADKAVVKTSLYQYPFLQLAEATLAVNLSGMGVHFIDLCKEIFPDRIKQHKIPEDKTLFFNQVLQEQEEKLDSVRTIFFEAVEASWNNMSDNAAMEAVSKNSRQLAKTARESVDVLYPYCGLIVASTESEINQVWRDIHTASQHALLTFL